MANQPAPVNWMIQPRQRTAGYSLFASYGKHYSRTVHQVVPGGYILDIGADYEKQRRANPADNNIIQSPEYLRYYLPLRTRFGPSIDDQLVNDLDGSFRQECAKELHKGRSQGRTDDLVVVKRVLARHPVFRNLPNDAAHGFSNDLYASLLCTSSLNLNDIELRAALNAGTVDAPANQLFAALFQNYTFPGANAHPLTGVFKSDLFVDVLLGIFLGPRAAQHLTPGSGGQRSKARKHDMTTLTKPSIAYAAMLLRFCLHQNESWYTVESNADTRYNYFILYTEILALLEEPTFLPQVNELLAYLNGIVFPHHHNLPANYPAANGGPSAVQLAMAHVNALAGAGHN
ncbi:hypothetical protein FRC12_007998 [Ceratobasidium sp. 428]|nr:hypothetical protein FRC09_011632 [Ceratobasidium sp. 395]KAG8764621.1 hypothetical protein FRC12_007998 [Ceratobasidium sp. 428]